MNMAGARTRGQGVARGAGRGLGARQRGKVGGGGQDGLSGSGARRRGLGKVEEAEGAPGLMKHPSGLGGEREGGGRRGGGGRGATKQSAKKAAALGTPRRKGGSSRTTDSSKANVKSKGGKRASPEVEGGEDEDEWAEWYAEMAQYEGWERGEGSNIAGSLVVVDPSIPADVAQVRDQIASRVLEDAEERVAIVHILADAGLSAARILELGETLRNMPFTDDRRGLVLLGEPTRDLHVKHFGWARFRARDIDFMLTGTGKRFVEMGAGSGWLAYLLREKGAHVDAFDAMEGGTFVGGWQGWTWSKSVAKGSVEVLEELKREKMGESKNGREFADDRTLLLCWPDLDSGFATACLSAYTGDNLIYVGEARGGSTAEGSFFDALARHWLLERSTELKRFAGSDVSDKVFVYSRKVRSSRPGGASAGAEGVGKEDTGSNKRRRVAPRVPRR